MKATKEEFSKRLIKLCAECGVVLMPADVHMGVHAVFISTEFGWELYVDRDLEKAIDDATDSSIGD